MDCDSEHSDFNLLKEDPEMQVKLVDKYVQIRTAKNCTFKGFLHSIDPVTYSVILSIPQEDKFQTTVIPGHAILDVLKEPLQDNLKPPNRKPIHTDTKEDLFNKKKKLIAWFESNLLPVKELDDKIVIGNVSLLSPYSILDLHTENPVIAIQIKKLMEQIPNDLHTL